MQLIRQPADLATNGRKVCLAIGVFDGVHLGHQQIIRQTIADARQQGALSVVVTFDRHPNAIVAPDRVPPQIYPLAQKLRTIETLGAEALLLLEFNRAFSQQTGEQFIRQLARAPGQLHSICVGADFVFGHRRSGNVALLRQLGQELGFTVHGMAALALDGETVSSTRIRDAIQGGDLDAASQMLSRPYTIASVVMAGDQLGRQLGFPTANLDVTGLVLPPDGVYAARVLQSGTGVSPVQFSGGVAPGQNRQDACPTIHRAVLNIGVRPTVKTGRHERRFEVHLLGFAGNLYGQELEVEFVAKLRDEMKFASLDALKAQIADDLAAAAKCF